MTGEIGATTSSSESEISDKGTSPDSCPKSETSGIGTSSGKKQCIYQPDKLCNKKYKIINLIEPGTSDGDKLSISTNRIVRIFESHDGTKSDLLYRMDWILPIKDEFLACDKISGIGTFDDVIIIIDDHGRGVINYRLIKALYENIEGKKRLFFRTKVNNPNWLQYIKENNKPVELMVFDYQLAKYRKGERRWWYGNNLGRAALELLGYPESAKDYLDNPTGKSVLDVKRVAVLLDNNTVIAKYRKSNCEESEDKGSKNRDACFCISKQPGEKQKVNIGRTTTFFAALIGQILSRRSDSDFYAECYRARDCAYAWSKLPAASDDDKLKRDPKIIIGDLNDAANKGGPLIPSGSIRCYDELWDEWRQSGRNFGIIEYKKRHGDANSSNKLVLELWRAEGALENYICLGGPKRKAINHLVLAINKFKEEKDSKHHLGCLITSSPGWGKSFLAECLAKQLGMEFLEYSIAQLATSQDFIGCLTSIASVQNRTNRKLLIFIDEINAKVEGHDIMSLILGPVSNGAFVFDGKSYRLAPAAWVFASTTRITDIIRGDASSKGSDFASRLNGPIIELDSLGAGERLAEIIPALRNDLSERIGKGIEGYESIYNSSSPYRALIDQRLAEECKDDEIRAVLQTEQVYLMTQFLIQIWGPINQIERRVLQLFYDIFPVNGNSSLKFFASNFREIKDSEVVAANVPDLKMHEELRRHILLPKDWFNFDDIVKIYGREKDCEFIQIENSHP